LQPVDASLRPATAELVRLEGDLLAVSHGARLASVCVKCATRDDVVRRLEVMHAQRPWMWLFYLTGVLGIVILSFLQRTGGVLLPICTACDARWRRAVRVRSLTTLAIIPVSVAAIGALAAEARGRLPNGAGAWIALALAAAWTAAYVAVHAGKSRRAMVTAASIDRSLIFLRGVHPDARRELVAEATAVRHGAGAKPRSSTLSGASADDE